MNIATRTLTAADYPVVCRIYEQGIAFGNATYETESPTWQRWDASHLSICRVVVTVDDVVAGFSVLSPTSPRKVFSGVCEVSIYLDEAYRHQGLGTILLTTLIAESEAHGIWMLTAGIFPENAASLALHQKCGFRIVGRRERIGKHQNGTWRDILLLERRSKINGLD